MDNMRRILILTLFGIMSTQGWAGPSELPLLVDTGFFERQDALASAALELPMTTDMNRAVLRDEAGQAVPFWFAPTAPGRGHLHWILAGKTDSLTQLPFTLDVVAGEWAPTPGGDPIVADVVRTRDNLIPNGGFEQGAQQEVSTTWKGTEGAEGWELHDYAWRHRNLPNLKAQARPQTELASEGTTALRLIAEWRAEDSQAATAKGVSIFPYINGPVVALKPDTQYRFSYRVRFTDVARDGHVSASVNFLDADRKRIFPRKYALNRLQCAYGTARNLPETYMDKWVTARAEKRTLPDVRYGQIVLSVSFAGTCYVDEFRLREVEAGPPVTVTVGPLRGTKEQ